MSRKPPEFLDADPLVAHVPPMSSFEKSQKTKKTKRTMATKKMTRTKKTTKATRSDYACGRQK